MNIKMMTLITLLGLSSIAHAENNMKYLGFEFGKSPDAEFLKISNVIMLVVLNYVKITTTVKHILLALIKIISLEKYHNL